MRRGTAKPPRGSAYTDTDIREYKSTWYPSFIRTSPHGGRLGATFAPRRAACDIPPAEAITTSHAGPGVQRVPHLPPPPPRPADDGRGHAAPRPPGGGLRHRSGDRQRLHGFPRRPGPRVRGRGG